MTTATQPDRPVIPAQAGNQRDPRFRGDDTKRKPLAKRLRNALFAEWAKLSPTLEWECSEREARIRFANEIVGARHGVPIQSWSELTTGQAKRLLREMKERSGSNAAWRAQFIARLAVRLFGSDWDQALAERVRARHGVPLQELSPAQAHETIEELLSRIARAEGREIEELRREIRKKPVGARHGVPNSEG